ncbi:alpha-mannosidase [Lapillicoccus jejuensis]|uniref:Alpha-mannosidase n=1 Tax=Lapillicoccus jejuensis TaxID=402171 RepID=A0A542E0L7_9MICO|nr:glycoside hydrolase family 38 C-terminal domain-containing protein [Lapillicoccus jejuensis]TQJ08734.1 alpha-mannosidase [Lapillicoccus jejuensis]
MHSHPDTVLGRIRRLVDERVTPARVRRRHPLTVASWAAPGEPVDVAEALGASYGPAEPGLRWGAPWSTWWFRVTGELPREWRDDGLDPADPEVLARLDVRVDLGFVTGSPGFQCEGTAWSPDGRVLKGISPFNHHVPGRAVLTRGGEDRWDVDLLVEAAGNPDTNPDFDFAPTGLGSLDTAGDEPLYVLGAVELVERDLEVEALAADLATLRGLLDTLDPTRPRHGRVLEALDRCADALDPDDVAGTATDARAELAAVLASPAHASAHRAVAVGHAHIDSAWLWPARETVRKCARTFANALSLLEEDPDAVFVASSAQQYAWVEERYPDLFARIRDAVAAGRWVPVGGMWVESDTNLPSGESLVRQLVEGTRYFLERFGVETDDVWLPDSFGYTAALPQLARAAGKKWLLTQKMSWNDSNRVPHSTFWWEGLDGTRLLTHLPPVDTYTSHLSAAELTHAETSYAEHRVGTVSLVPYGYGDGGGGPTREMAAQAARTRDLEGSVRVGHGVPDDFARAARAELVAAARPGRPAPSWSGELYLEFHRGTYTSQARTKAGNRRVEHLLREAELWSATATLRTGRPYPADLLRASWRELLLHQFHDVLPGSSIAWVHDDAQAAHARLTERLETVVADALAALAGDGDDELVANAAPHSRDGILAQGLGAPTPVEDRPVRERDGDGWRLRTGSVSVGVDAAGRVVSLRGADGREAVPPAGAVGALALHRDLPNRWDAWDLDRHHRQVVLPPTAPASVEPVDVDGLPALRVTHRLGASTVVQDLVLRPGAVGLELRLDVDWHERAKALVLTVDTDLRADDSAAEIQHGHVRRPVAENTSWDAARYEVCAHRWLHVGERGYGVAVVNDATYGHGVTRAVREADGGTTTTVALTLLRSATYPDPRAEEGRHVRTVLVVPGADVADAVVEGHRLGLPRRVVRGSGPVDPVVTVAPVAGAGDAVVDAVKLADDGSGDLVVRLYEALGARTTVRVDAPGVPGGWQAVDLLERPLTPDRPVALEADGTLVLRPFELATLRRSPGAY